jgi:hypothetical protein
MKAMMFGLALLGGMMGVAGAQAPQGAPTGATGICKDGTYSTAASKSGACGGHKGVQTWYAAAPASGALGGKSPAVAPAQNVGTPAMAHPATAPVPGPTMTPRGPSAVAAAKPQAPGGGPGMVWVNTSSNVYHCPGTTYYGKTKEGSYMTEAQAKAKGAHGERGATCSK